MGDRRKRKGRWMSKSKNGDLVRKLRALRLERNERSGTAMMSMTREKRDLKRDLGCQPVGTESD